MAMSIAWSYPRSRSRSLESGTQEMRSYRPASRSRTQPATSRPKMPA